MPLPDHDLPAAIRALDDQAWLGLLLRSLDGPEVDGLRFPGFPPAATQRRFVGADGPATLQEAFRFYTLVKARAAALGVTLAPGKALLDFGCGWGRFLRFFWKDVGAAGLHGCDAWPEAIALCRSLGVPGNLDRLYHWGRLPYADASMDLALAYSVFTHLPEAPHRHWVAEIARVMKPGGVFVLTLEPRRFLDFVAALPADASGWEAQLRRHAEAVPALRARFDAGGIAFLPSGGAGDFDSTLYGDAAVPRAFIEQHWSRWFAIRDYLDDPGRFFQAVLVVQRL
jgi:SAM-dependent methyltransferase